MAVLLPATAASGQKLGDYIARAKAGDMVAEYNAGICCLYGYGVEPDTLSAFDWFNLSAAQGYAQSQTRVAVMLHDGFGGRKPDPAAAAAWHRKAAEQGSALSQYLLGCQYLDGDGVCQDSSVAADWFSRAAQQNLPSALAALGNCHANGTGVTADRTAALRYYRLGAEAGDASAARFMNTYYRLSAPQLAAYWGSAAQGGAEPVDYYDYEGYSNGCYYGELRRGHREGCGVYAWDSGSIYRGEWIEDLRSGIGTTVFAHSVHYGAYSSEADGYGALVVTDPGSRIAGCNGGKVYVGYFRNGKPEGTGTVYDADGKVLYYGDFASGSPTGEYPSSERYSAYAWVTDTYPSGDGYEGETYNSLRDGFGIYRWADGAMWFGSWSGGNRNGTGLYISADGRMVAGTWIGNELQ